MTIKKKINMAALIAPAGGMGSHLVLHKMHGHHKIMAQQEISFRNTEFSSGLFHNPSWEGTTSAGLKQLLRGYRMKPESRVPEYISNEQLSPPKHLAGVDWVILNKPRMKQINSHRNYNPNVPILYLFKNPVSFFYSWIKKWENVHDEDVFYDVSKLSDEKVIHWIKNTFLTSLVELAQTYNPDIDYIVSFDHMVGDVDSELGRIFDRLGVERIKDKDLIKMTHCTLCNQKLYREEIPIKRERTEEVLHCPGHGKILGPGEYNYIRKEDPSMLEKWKKNDNIEEVCDRFSNFFGKDLIEYYLNSEYATDTDRKVFDKLFQEFLGRLKFEI